MILLFPFFFRMFFSPLSYRSIVEPVSVREDFTMKLIVLRRTYISVLIFFLTACMILAFVNHPAFVGASASTRQLPIYCVQKEYKVCSLSFDAAWGNEDTEELISILDRYQISATFFVVGE